MTGKIKLLLEEKGVSQAELAESVGVSQAMIRLHCKRFKNTVGVIAEAHFRIFRRDNGRACITQEQE